MSVVKEKEKDNLNATQGNRVGIEMNGTAVHRNKKKWREKSKHGGLYAGGVLIG